MADSASEQAPKGAGRRIDITPATGRVVVRFNGETVADSTRALLLSEEGYPPVTYLPLEDVLDGALSASAHRTHCPFKGDAAYYDLSAGGKTAENAVWTYPDPIGPVAEIEGFVAFYLGKIEGLELSAQP